jgi:hypothetical protein
MRLARLAPLTLLVFTAAAISAGLAGAQVLAVTPIQNLLQTPDQYDGKTVTVDGTITAYRERVSRQGHAYTTFRVGANGRSVSVFAWKPQGLANGLRVRVTGTFSKEKHVGRYTFRNEIEAQRIERLR